VIMRRELAITHRGLVQVQIQEFTADSTLDPAFTSQPFSYTAAEPGGQDTPDAIGNSQGSYPSFSDIALARYLGP
jgi:hypothetical protein